MSGQLFVISAPSGAGKTSLVKAVTAQESNLLVSVSYTTRPMRPGEIEGVDYYFIDEEKFQSMLGESRFIESAQVFDYHYGTGQRWVEKHLRDDRDVILEIDWQGAEQIHRILPDAIRIFILPPSIQALEDRLRSRGQDSEEVIQNRIAKAKIEVSHCVEYDYWIVNDDFGQALTDLKAIIRARRLKIAHQRLHLASLVNSLT